MWRLADQQLDEFASQGTCEFLEDYARPFSGLVIVDLLGIPPKDHEQFRALFSGQVVGGIEDDVLTGRTIRWSG
jgi:cytochrome P450